MKVEVSPVSGYSRVRIHGVLCMWKNEKSWEENVKHYEEVVERECRDALNYRG